MGSVNRVILVGRLGKDPVLRQTKAGKDFCTLALATSKKYGEEEKTQWHNISIFNDNTARFVAKYACKGTVVSIEGEIEYRMYDKSGVQMLACDIVVGQYNGDVQILLDGVGRGVNEAKRPDDTGAKRNAYAKASREEEVEANDDRLDDEIPF